MNEGWVEWALEGVAVGMAGIAGTGLKMMGALRKEREEGDRRLWERSEEIAKLAASARLEDARNFVTKDDLRDLKSDLVEAFNHRTSTLEERVGRMIANRPRVKDE